jgi:integrase
VESRGAGIDGDPARRAAVRRCDAVDAPGRAPVAVVTFNHAFVDAVRVAGLPDGHGFHGLRKAMAANLAGAGATDAEMDALVYHSDPKMTRLYRAGADHRSLARAGMAKLLKAGK